MMMQAKQYSVLMFMLLLQALNARASLPEDLVSRFSSRWSEIQSELHRIDRELSLLPDIPLSDLGGTGGLISYLYHTTQDDEKNVFVHWDTPAPIDMVALVPARKFSATGLDTEFGLANFIEIELLDSNDQPVYTVARETAAAERTIRKGFPFVYTLSSPVEASGIRLRCRKLKIHNFVSGPIKTLALAELFCFSGRRNVAAGAAVDVAEGLKQQEHWYWRIPFLTDELTPLGLPETPESDLRHIGWGSVAHASVDEHITIDIELSQPGKLDGIRMFPAVHTSSGYPPGFALPQRFRLVAYDEGFVRPLHVILDQSSEDLLNPGHNPQTFHFAESTAQYVRLDCTRIWKNFPNYPAFLAFSEIQLLRGETNLAEGATVYTSEETGERDASPTMVWSRESLTNGYGPRGKLVSKREWLCLLKERFELEARRKALTMEAENMVAILRSLLANTFGGIGALAVLISFGLPVRYRIRERHELNKLRKRIADDLHDEVGANLSSIAGSTELLSEISEHQSPKQKELLADITETARKTAEETRALVYFLERKNFEGDLANQFHKAARQTLVGIHCAFNLSDIDAFERMPPMLKWDLLLFYKETLHNIFKHADADRVETRTHASDKSLQLIVLDNGRGMAAGIKPEHMQVRAKKMKAQLSIAPLAEGGTKVQLDLPRKRTYPWTMSSHS